MMKLQGLAICFVLSIAHAAIASNDTLGTNGINAMGLGLTGSGVMALLADEKPITLRFSADGRTALVDSAAAAPEPASGALALIGMLALLKRRRWHASLTS